MIGFKVNGFIALVLVAAVVDLPKGWMHRPSCTLYKMVSAHARRAGNDPRFRGHVRQADFDTGAAQRIATTLIATFGKKPCNGR